MFKYVIKRTEIYHDYTFVKFMNNYGFFDSFKDARRFDTRSAAKFVLECEKSNPLYERDFMGICNFKIMKIEIGGDNE